MVVCPYLCTGYCTHTNQYLQHDIHHHFSAKFSVINTLTHRAKTVCSSPELFHNEMGHLRKVLTLYNYLKWALDKVERRLNRTSSETSNGVNNRAFLVTKLPLMKLKLRGNLSYLKHKVFVKVSKRCVVGMAFKPISKHYQKSSGFPQGQRPFGQPK